MRVVYALLACDTPRGVRGDVCVGVGVYGWCIWWVVGCASMCVAQPAFTSPYIMCVMQSLRADDTVRAPISSFATKWQSLWERTGPFLSRIASLSSLADCLCTCLCPPSRVRFLRIFVGDQGADPAVEEGDRPHPCEGGRRCGAPKAQDTVHFPADLQSSSRAGHGPEDKSHRHDRSPGPRAQQLHGS